uniref:Uncharacterized protein n=1 Tax=Fusarium oxysporum (strain Fo5176) TaxID=660025 RepID=A0A0D2Y3K8_FUSOF
MSMRVCVFIPININTVDTENGGITGSRIGQSDKGSSSSGTSSGNEGDEMCQDINTTGGVSSRVARAIESGVAKSDEEGTGTEGCCAHQDGQGRDGPTSGQQSWDKHACFV